MSVDLVVWIYSKYVSMRDWLHRVIHNTDKFESDKINPNVMQIYGDACVPAPLCSTKWHFWIPDKTTDSKFNLLNPTVIF